jgi:hypothetical protein
MNKVLCCYPSSSVVSLILCFDVSTFSMGFAFVLHLVDSFHQVCRRWKEVNMSSASSFLGELQFMAKRCKDADRCGQI